MNGIVVLLAALPLLPLGSNAQAPASIAGDGIFVQYTSGTPPLVSYGYSAFLPANAGNTYQLVGIYPAGANSGTYSYSVTGPNTALATQNDTTDGMTFQLRLTFSTTAQGAFNSVTITPPGYSQAGNFRASVGTAPNSISGMTLLCLVLDGLYPFANAGSFTIAFSGSGTYNVAGVPPVSDSSGTYSYALVNRSTGVLQINDSVLGAFTLYIGFSSSGSGEYAAKNAAAFQIATFQVLDTTPPTVAITSPVAGQRWSNSVFTVTGTAGDNVQVSGVYYRNIAGPWNLATPANNWATWSGPVTLLPGTNVIQAYAVDTSGNNSSTNTHSVVYVPRAVAVIQTTGVGTVSPNYNGQLLVLGQMYSITATPGAGFAFSNWTGSVTSSAVTITFLMVSNLQLSANFVDITRPTLNVLSPTSGEIFTNPAAAIRGTASDNVKVAGVYYQLRTNAWKIATTTDGFTNWSATALLAAGTNILKVVAIDPAGNYSLTKSLSFDSTKAFSATLSFGSPKPLSSNGLAFALKTATGIVCRIDVSTNLVNWDLLTNITTATSSTVIRDFAATNASSRFYRAAVQQ